MYKIITLKNKRTGRAVGKSSRMNQTLVFIIDLNEVKWSEHIQGNPPHLTASIFTDLQLADFSGALSKFLIGSKGLINPIMHGHSWSPAMP